MTLSTGSFRIKNFQCASGEAKINPMQYFRSSLLSTAKLSFTKQFIGCPGSSCKLISSVTFLKYSFGKCLHWGDSVRKLKRLGEIKLLVWNFSIFH